MPRIQLCGAAREYCQALRDARLSRLFAQEMRRYLRFATTRDALLTARLFQTRSIRHASSRFLMFSPQELSLDAELTRSLILIVKQPRRLHLPFTHATFCY